MALVERRAWRFDDNSLGEHSEGLRAVSDVILCVRVRSGERPPVEGSTTSTCSECGHEVWLSPEGTKLRQKKGLTVVCMSCMARTVNDDPTANPDIRVTPEQMEEITREIIKDNIRRRSAS